MRPSFLAAAALAGLAFPLPAGAAGTCTVVAEPPRPIDGQVMATGTFTCAVASPGMTVTACVELLDPSAQPAVFRTLACDTTTASGSVTTVSATAFACVQGGPKIVRTVADGANAVGDAWSAASVPTLAPGVGSCGP